MQQCNYEPRIYNAKTAIDVIISRRDIVRFLEKFKRNMVIPDEILKSEKQVLASYLRGLYDTDGSCYANTGSARSGRLEFTNKREVLVKQVQTVLKNSFDIHSSITVGRKGDYDPVFRLFVSNKRNIVLFENQIGFLHPKKKERLSNFVTNYKDVHDRFMKGTAEGVIVDLLKRERELTTNTIADKLTRHRETIKEHLEKMEKRGLVKKRKLHFNRWGEVRNSSFMKYFWSAAGEERKL